MHSKSLPEPWKSFFSEIDAALGVEVELHCLGGFVMTILYGLERPTSDVDVLPFSTNAVTEFLMGLAGEGSKLHKKFKVYIQVVGVAPTPDGYEERLKEIGAETFKRLRLLGLDPYDLALSKLERNTQRDRDDVRHLARTVPFDLDMLKTRYEKELRPFLGNPRREDLTMALWLEAIEEERSQ